MPQTHPLQPGDPRGIGAYRLLGRLGKGAQGVVYQGQGPDGQLVAIKLLSARFAGAGPDGQRFLREVAAARRVAQFCTAQVLDASLDGESPYIVSEFVDGISLQEMVRAHGTRQGGVLYRLAVGTVTALAAIHRAGIVHRDFKPSNVLIGIDGPRVIDFGIARAFDAGMTTSSGVVGTPAYMSPEQISGERVGPASDMFSWALTVLYAATGRPAFGQDSLPAVVYRVMHEEADLSALPDSLRAVVRSCLRKRAGERPTAAETLFALLEDQSRGGSDDETALSTGSQVAAERPPLGAAPEKRADAPADPPWPAPLLPMPPPPPPLPPASPPPRVPPASLASPSPRVPPASLASPSPRVPPASPARSGWASPSGDPPVLPPASSAPGHGFPPPYPLSEVAPSPPGSPAPPSSVRSPAQPPPAQPPPAQPPPVRSPAPPPAQPPPAQPPPVRSPAPPSAGHHPPGYARPPAAAAAQDRPGPVGEPVAEDTSGPGAGGGDNDAFLKHVPGQEWPRSGTRRRRAAVVAGSLVVALSLAGSVLLLGPAMFAGSRTSEQPSSGQVAAPTPSGRTVGPSSAATVSSGPSVSPSSGPTSGPSVSASSAPSASASAGPSVSATAAPTATPAPAVTPTPGRLALGKQDGKSFKGHSRGVQTLSAITIGGRKMLVSGGQDGRLRIWDAAQHKSVASLRGHTQEVYAVGCVMVGRTPMAVSGGYDGSVRLWDLKTRKGRVLGWHADAVYAVAVTKVKGRWIAVTGDADGWLRTWDLNRRKAFGAPVRAHRRSVNWLGAGRVGARVVAVSASEDETLRVWDLAKRRPYGKTYRGHSRGVYAIAVGELDGEAVVASGGKDGKIRLWNPKSGKTIGKPMPGHKKIIYSLAFGSPGGRPVLLSGGTDGTLRLWDPRTGKPLGKTVKAHRSGVYAVALVEVDGEPAAVSAGKDKLIRLWSLEGVATGS